MFLSDFKEKKEGKVTLGGVSFRALKIILTFIYYHELDLTTDDVESVLSAAHLFQLDKIVQFCHQYMLKHMSAEMCFTFARLFELYTFEEGQNAVRDFILENFVTVSTTPDFLDVSKEALCSYLCDENLKAPLELDLFKAVKAWLEHDKERMEYCYELMKKISLGFIPKDSLTNEVASFLEQDGNCKELLTEALCYHDNLYAQPTVNSTISKQRGKPGLLVINFNSVVLPDQITATASIIELSKLQERIGPFMRIGVPLADDSASLVKFNNFLYLFGVDSRDFSNVTLRYDGNIGKWIKLAPAPSKADTNSAISRVGHTIIKTGGQYIQLGDKYTNESSFTHNKTYLYDVLTNKWTSSTPFPEDVAGAATCTFQDRMYVVGGYSYKRSAYSNKMWMYNQDGEAWLAKPDFIPQIPACQKVVMGVLEEKLLLVDVKNKTVQLFNTKLDQWTKIETNKKFESSKFSGKSVFVFNNALNFIGGNCWVIGAINIRGEYKEWLPECDRWVSAHCCGVVTTR